MMDCMLMFSIPNQTEYFRNELKTLIDRLMILERLKIDNHLICNKHELVSGLFFTKYGTFNFWVGMKQ